MNTTSHFPGSQPTPDSPSPAEAAEAPEARPPTGAGPGRPSSLWWQKLFAICQYIRTTGVSDTAAAAMCGVSRSALSRWKAADEMVECELDKARAEYQMPRLRIIDMMKRADGELDWRAQAWLVKHAAQGELGRPSPRRKLKEWDHGARGSTRPAPHPQTSPSKTEFRSTGAFPNWSLGTRRGHGVRSPGRGWS